MAMSTTCYNPFLYGWHNDSFRKEFVKMVPLLKGVCGYADDGANEMNATCATAARAGLTTRGASGGSALRQQQQQLLQQTVEINGNNNHATEEMNAKVASNRDKEEPAVVFNGSVAAIADGGGEKDGTVNGNVLE